MCSAGHSVLEFWKCTSEQLDQEFQQVIKCNTVMCVPIPEQESLDSCADMLIQHGNCCRFISLISEK